METTTEKTSEHAVSEDLRGWLLADHERLERLFAELLTAFKADAREDAARLWNVFDAGLRAHLELEEKYIFPEFAKVRAADVTTLSREHERIREQLLDLGVGVDLHVTKDDQVEQFIHHLRGHAAREDALMYQWAARELPAETRARIRDWFHDLRTRTHRAI